MNDVFAFLVGIDTYDQEGWTIRGPCANAIAIAEWLLNINVIPSNIYLFLDTEDVDLKSAIDDLSNKGVNLKRSATKDVIDTFWRQDLRGLGEPNSRLLTYWSGHGVVDRDGDRIFYLRDYQLPGLLNRVFNCTKMHRHLRGPDYQHFQEQICLADVCGTKADSPIKAAKDSPNIFPDTTQVAFFASPEGEYAKGHNGVGVFTQIALQVLKDAWPKPSSFTKAMNDAFNALDHAIFKVAYVGKHDNIPEKRVGKIVEDRETETFNAVFPMLASVKLSDSEYRFHYLRTVRDLGMPELNEAQGLVGMVRELAGLCDSERVSDIPRGLLQFLLRLREEPLLKVLINDWLAQHATAQGNAIVTIKNQLSEECGRKILIVELTSDTNGSPESYQLYLRTSTLLPVPGLNFAARPVAGWAEFEADLAAQVEKVQADPIVDDLEIHILADPPMFPRPFHKIETTEGALGGQYVVVLRDATRLRSTKRVIKAAWRRYAEELRKNAPGEIELLEISANIETLPKNKGICYTSFVLPPDLDAVVPSAEIKTLVALLRRGTPYLYWFHSLPANHDMTSIEKQIQDWLVEKNTLDEFPMTIAEARLASNELATEATLLWDDPEFNPFQYNKGVVVK